MSDAMCDGDFYTEEISNDGGNDANGNENGTNGNENDDIPPASPSSIPVDSPAPSLNCSQNSNSNSSSNARPRHRIQFVDSIIDANRYPLKLERFFHEHDLMVPKDKDLDSIEANEKSWTMVRPGSPSVTDGISWSFVDICSGLSTELLKVCHFFDVMNGLSNLHPWNGFAVPTTDISDDHQSNHHQSNHQSNHHQTYDQSRHLRLKYNKKDVVGVIDSKYVEHAHSRSLCSSDGRGVDTRRLLWVSESNSVGTQDTVLPLFKIQLGFTAAFFKADPPHAEDGDESEQRQATFGVVTITSLRNVDALKLIVVSIVLYFFLSTPLPEKCHSLIIYLNLSLPSLSPISLSQDRLLAAPSARASNFSNAHKRQRDLLELFEHILIYQAYGVLNDDSSERPNRFYANPNGRLGIDTICNPFLEPFKICKLLEKHFNSPHHICIVGYPQINWQGNIDIIEGGSHSDSDLRDYVQYSSACLGHQVDARSKLSEAALEFYTQEKKSRRRKADHEEEAKEEFPIPGMYGCPIRARSGWYTEFATCLCPINMQLRRLCEIDVDESLQCWTLNLGAIPPLALCLIRGCLLFDPESPETIRLDSILLRELDVPGNLQLIRHRFYNTSAFSHKHIAMQGCQEGNYVDIMNHIQTSVKSDSMSAGTAVHLLTKATEYGINVFVSMVESNSFLSARVTQSMELMKKIAHEERTGRANFCKGMRVYQRSLLGLPGITAPDDDIWQRGRETPHFAALLSPYDRARRTLLLSLIDVNRFYRLNSGNLQLMLEIMISMIAHTIGGRNKTHDMFGRGLEIAPCCGTLSEWVQSANNKRIRVRNTANPNSAGKDFTCNKITNIFTLFCQKYGVHESLQGLTVIKRFTPVAMESFTTLQSCQGKIVGTPDEELNMAFFIMTEARGTNVETDQNTLITNVYRRGEQQKDCSITTGEDSKKMRHAVTKVQVSPVMLCTRCGNKKPETLVENEQINTISAVVAMIECGSRVYVPGTQEGEFGDVETDINEARSAPFEGDTERYAKEMLAGTHLHGTTWLGIPNFIHTFAAEINPVVLSTIDWVSFYMQRHLDSILHPFCRGNNWLRLRRVYESRAVAFTAWCKMFQFLTDCKNRETAIQRAVCSFQIDALALTDVIGMAWSFLRRSLHWGPVLYACCFIRECNMPIVPTKILVKLLSADDELIQLSNESTNDNNELKVWHDRIARWLVDCVAEHRFCPADEMTYSGDYCEYITSAGLPDGSVETSGVLRVNQPTNSWKEVPSLLADTLWSAYGLELHHACSLTKESMLCALEDMLNEFSVEIQKLFGVNMFDMQRHLQFFGLRDRLNWRCKDRNGKHPFMIKACWPKGPNETASIGGGLHVIQLLLLGSLVGDVSALHPKIISELSVNLFRQILSYAPAGIVPGNFVELRNFDCYTGKLIPFDLEEGFTHMESFLRPCDLSFAETGDLTFCKNIGNFAAEDVLHMGPLCELARKIGCKVYDIPATAEVNYYPRPRKAYCIYDPLRCLQGYIVITETKITMEFQGMQGDDQLSCACTLPLLSWQEEMSLKGFIMLPMVWRCGACVAITAESGNQSGNQSGSITLGCLVPPEDMVDEDGFDPVFDGNFSMSEMGYRALVRVGVTVKVPLMTMLQTLLPIGQRLYLKMESQSAGPLLRRVRSVLLPEQTALRVHLFSPGANPISGRVYVACKMCKIGSKVASATVLTVNPWELLLELGERDMIQEIYE